MNENNDKWVNKSVINWYPGHMAKTKRLISEQINLIDIVYEVVDARMPLSSKIIDIDDYTKNKPKIMIIGQDWGPYKDMKKLYNLLNEDKSNWKELIESEKSSTKKMLEKYIKESSNKKIFFG